MVDVEEAIDRIPAFTSLAAHLDFCLAFNLPDNLWLVYLLERYL